MLSFKSFINAIHDAILSANEELMERNTAILDKYFIDPSDDSNVQQSLDDAFKASQKVTDPNKNVTQDDFLHAMTAMEKANQALKGSDPSKSISQSGVLSPKTVVVEYPQQTANGLKKVEVHVPLITLVPLSMSQVEKAVIKTDFEMEMINDELQLNFTKSRSKLGSRSKTKGSLEVTISPQESSEGLKALIEGYEKALKAQIPH